MQKERNIAFDILKGIGILLMIIGHSIDRRSIWFHLIYTFHMPLFFIVAGFFFKVKPTKEIIVNSYKRLIIPYLFICFNVILLRAIKEFYSSGHLFVDYKYALYVMGPGWFLVSLFEGRILFNYLIMKVHKYHLPVSILLSSFPLLLNLFIDIDEIPFFIMPTLCCLPFISVGYVIKKHHLITMIHKRKILFSLVFIFFWILTILFGEINLANCVIHLWLIDYVGATAATLFFYIFCIYIANKPSIIRNLLSEISKFSIVILCFHTIDYCVPMWFHLSPIIPNGLGIPVVIIGRLILAYYSVLLSKRITILKRTFSLS